MRRVILALLALCPIAGCAVSSTDPYATFSRVRVAPLGPGQYMVSCVDSPQYCAAEANRVCPGGLAVVSNTVNPADFGRMTMIVKCSRQKGH